MQANNYKPHLYFVILPALSIQDFSLQYTYKKQRGYGKTIVHTTH